MRMISQMATLGGEVNPVGEMTPKDPKKGKKKTPDGGDGDDGDASGWIGRQ